MIKNSNIRYLLEIVGDEKCKKLISVGDATSSRLQELGITPNLVVVDNKIERVGIKPLETTARIVYRVKNPPGTITEEAWRAVADAMNNNEPTKIIIDGEEDLITLLAVYEAPVGSTVLYGQPGEGVVAIKVTEDKKKEISQMIDEMRKIPKTKN